MRGLRGLACPHEEARVSAVSHGVQLPRHRRERPTHGGDELQQQAQVLRPAARGTETRHGPSDMQTVGDCCSVLNMAARPVAPRHPPARVWPVLRGLPQRLDSGDMTRFPAVWKSGSCPRNRLPRRGLQSHEYQLESGVGLERVPVPAQPVVLTFHIAIVCALARL